MFSRLRHRLSDTALQRERRATFHLALASLPGARLIYARWSLREHRRLRAQMQGRRGLPMISAPHWPFGQDHL